MAVERHIRWMKTSSFHGRRGAIRNNFRYRLSCLLVPIPRSHDEQVQSPTNLVSVNSFGLFAFYDKDHGIAGEATDSVAHFATKILKDQNLEHVCDGPITLLTQPRFLGYIFNPVSFWFFQDKAFNLRAVVAEVNNTAGGRHFYICRHDDFAPIQAHDKITVEKIFYVSPFQEVAGEYTFKFQFDKDKVGAWIDYKNGDDGLYATMTGKPETLTTFKALKGAIALPFGAMRVISLIHWQALKLKLKGAAYRRAPTQNKKRISR